MPLRVFIPRASRFALPPEHYRFQYALLLKQRLPYFFTSKPSDFSVFDTKVWEIFFTGNGLRLIAEGMEFKTEYIFSVKAK